MFLNRSSQYALELVLYLSNHPEERYVRINEIAKKLELSFHFLGKIAQALVKNNILVSVRGPKGGFGLADPSKKITQLDVIKATHGDKALNQCVLRPRECDCEKPCPLHSTWDRIMQSVKEALNESPIHSSGQP